MPLGYIYIYLFIYLFVYGSGMIPLKPLHPQRTKMQIYSTFNFRRTVNFGSFPQQGPCLSRLTQPDGLKHGPCGCIQTDVTIQYVHLVTVSATATLHGGRNMEQNRFRTHHGYVCPTYHRISVHSKPLRSHYRVPYDGWDGLRDWNAAGNMLDSSHST
jgi:hypothetical protein